MARKINVAVVKEFLFNHGEKVALGTCAFLALLFGTLGLFRAMSAGKPEGSSKTWTQEFTDQRNRINTSMAGAPAPTFSASVEEKMTAKPYDWKWIPSNYQQSLYTVNAEPNTSKRVNPKVLPIKANGRKEIQLDYIRALVHVHEFSSEKELQGFLEEKALGIVPPMEKEKGKGKGKNVLPVEPLPPLVKGGRPTRMVVVTAAFPMRQQVEEFQRALRMTTQEEMFKPPQEDLPRVLGINVLKYEIVNGKPVNEDGEILIKFNPKTQKLTKAEKVQDQETGKPVWIVDGVEHKVRPSVAALDDLLRIAMYDEDTPEFLKEFIWHGLNTPLPKLANAQYPKFNFDGFEIAWDDYDAMHQKKEMVVGMMPKKGIDLPFEKRPKGTDKMKPGDDPKAIAGADRKIIEIKSKDLAAADPILYRRLFEKDGKKYSYNMFHVLGLDPPEKDERAKDPVRPGPEMVRPMPAPGMGKIRRPVGPASPDQYFSAWDIDPPMPEMPKDDPKKKVNPKDPKDLGPQVPAWPNWERDAIVRFIDPDVVPGKTYQYAIQVRMANPNHGKVDLVAYSALAKPEELEPSEWKLTPPVTIPQDYFLYAVDQQMLDDKMPMMPLSAAYLKEYTTFQIHQWTEKARDKDNGPGFMIGDWVVAERVTVRRGEQIGSQIPEPEHNGQIAEKEQTRRHAELIVRVPVWQKKKDSFEMPFTRAFDGPKKQPKAGLDMNFKRDDERPLLVDFIGGKRLDTKEETAVDALILSADGKLTVLNSRAGAEAVQPDFPEPVRRSDRVRIARDNANAYNANPAPPIPPKK